MFSFVIAKEFDTDPVPFLITEVLASNIGGTATLIGIRRAESKKRANRNEVEISGRKFSGSLDQFNRTQEVADQCMAKFGKKDKLIIAPIIEWSDKDVWDFIHDRKLAYCKLYDEGWKRIGCLFCPMARKAEQQMAKERYPKYKAAIIRVIKKIRNRENGGVCGRLSLT